MSVITRHELRAVSFVGLASAAATAYFRAGDLDINWLGMAATVAATLAVLDFLLQAYKIAFGVRHAKDIDYSLLKARLRHYAFMLEGKKADVLPQTGLILNGAQHKVLLGIIKKIETKNAVLSAINVFLVLALLRVLVDFQVAQGGPWLFYASLSAATAAVFLIVARLDGISHLSQTQSSAIILSNRTVAPVEMQKALMANLLQKEAVFSMSLYVVAGIAVVPLIAAAIAALKCTGCDS